MAGRVLVTGASRGIGRALALAFARRGALCPGVTESGFQKEADVALPGGFASAKEVAAFALRALDAKKRVAVHGKKNALLVFSQRLSPRIATVKVAKRIMQPWFRERKGRPA
jgi:short-subunit dehydrogenase